MEAVELQENLVFEFEQGFLLGFGFGSVYGEFLGVAIEFRNVFQFPIPYRGNSFFDYRERGLHFVPHLGGTRSLGPGILLEEVEDIRVDCPIVFVEKRLVDR
jgi:hypothetical protein